MTNWKASNLSLSVSYLFDSYITYHNLHSRNRYVNAIELLHRSLVYYMYSKFKEHEIQSKKDGWYENFTTIIDKDSELKQKEFIYKLNDFRNAIVHRLGGKDYSIDAYNHNFFVNTITEMKELILNTYPNENFKLNSLELNLQTKFCDLDNEENDITKLIKQQYGEDFYTKKVKIQYINIKSNENPELIYRVVKSLAGKTEEEKNELLKNAFTIVIDPNPKAVRDKFRYTYTMIKEFYLKRKIDKLTILNKKIKELRTESTRDNEWYEPSNNTYRYTIEFVEKIFETDTLKKDFLEYNPAK